MLPLPPRVVKALARKFRGIGRHLSRLDSKLNESLFQSDMGFNAAEYLGLALFSGVIYGVLGFGLTALVSYSENGVIGGISIIIGFILMAASFFFMLLYPRVVSAQLSKQTDQDMLSAMRHLVIEIRSGVPLFNAMVGMTKDYGQVSIEFSKIVNDINGGMKDIDALNKAAERNTSPFFRRAIWQMVNSMKAGSDVANTMDDVTKSLAKNQELQIRKYGQELNPLTMMYMIISVIFPSLGITFLIILSSFSGISIPPLIFPIIIIFLVIFQFFFLGFIKTRRPNVIV